MPKRIAVIGTLDTKGNELGYVRDTIADMGHLSVVINTGILGTPGIEPDITREQVAAGSGTTIDEIIQLNDKANAIEKMAHGLADVVAELHRTNRLDGAIAVGGAQGTLMGTTALQALPLGVPKVMVSTVANGKTTFGPFVGTSDMAIMHSVADILGLNFVTRKVLARAAGAVIGMAEAHIVAEHDGRPRVAITMCGVTTPCAMRAREQLERLGYEAVVFHCNGVGAKAMEEFVSSGEICGVLDLSPHDVTDYLFDGLMPASPDRFMSMGAVGLPVVFAPGGCDFILYGPRESVPERVRQRRHVAHSSIHTHVRTTREEMREVGAFVAERLSQSKGSAVVLVPRCGFSEQNNPEGPLFAPESDEGFTEGLKAKLRGSNSANVRVREMEVHINDAEFAEAAADSLHEMVERCERVPK